MKICAKHPELGGLRLPAPSGRKLGRCVACNKENGQRHYEKNKARLRAEHREYARANVEKNTERAVAWAKANREQHNANAKAWRAANPGKAYSYTAAWAKANPEKAAAMAGKYRATQSNATPAWANKFFIAEAYHLAKLREKVCGGKWHVDHIVPLKSARVCGLHVEQNLRVIPGAENSRKGNRHWPDSA